MLRPAYIHFLCRNARYPLPKLARSVKCELRPKLKPYDEVSATQALKQLNIYFVVVIRVSALQHLSTFRAISSRYG